MINGQCLKRKLLTTGKAAIIIKCAKSHPFFGGVGATVIQLFGPPSLYIGPRMLSPFGGVQIVTFIGFVLLCFHISAVIGSALFRAIGTILPGLGKFFSMFFVVLALGNSAQVYLATITLFFLVYAITCLAIAIQPVFSTFGLRELIYRLFSFTPTTDFYIHWFPAQKESPADSSRRYCLGNTGTGRAEIDNTRYAVTKQKRRGTVLPKQSYYSVERMFCQ